MSETTIKPTLPDDVALRVTDVAKQFKLPTEKSTSLKQSVINWLRGIRGYKIQKVLKNISFDVKKGDFFGIVGKNGSGKSTLLKIISEIYTPNGGSVDHAGKLVPFIELGVGFNPELTGRENVYLNGAMLGFSNEEIDAMYDDIVEFAELQEFMEQKLKNYSSGMQVRLAFSVAIKSKGDILVLDEVLAVGDEAFQKKCQEYFFDAKRQKRTIILVTHSMADVRRYCNRAMFIQDGEISMIGDPDDIADAYSNSFLNPSQLKEKLAQQAVELQKKKLKGQTIERWSDKELEEEDSRHGTVKALTVCVDGTEQKYLDRYEDFSLKLSISLPRPTASNFIHLDVVDGRGWLVFSASTTDAETRILDAGIHELEFSVENVLAFGDYHIDVVFDNGSERELIKPAAYQFHMKGFASAAMPVTVPRTQAQIIE